MPSFVDRRGQKFGKLLVLHRGKNTSVGTVAWVCQCDCGKRCTVRANNLTSGNSTSCGCGTLAAITKHGHAKNYTMTRTYNCWLSMLNRTRVKQGYLWECYGARGIKVCRRWLKFENFLADMGERPKGLTLERRNNDRGYSPSNCRWATRAEQMRNTRRNVHIKFNGVSKVLADWAREVGVAPATLSKRIQVWGLSRALTTPRFTKPWNVRHDDRVA